MKYLAMVMCLVLSANAFSWQNNPYEPRANTEAEKAVKRYIQMEEDKQRDRDRGITPGPLWEGNWGGRLN